MLIADELMRDIRRRADEMAAVTMERETSKLISELCQRVNALEARKEMSLAQLTEYQAYLKHGKWIQAIKLVRDVYGMGLKEAKDFVDAWRDKINYEIN